MYSASVRNGISGSAFVLDELPGREMHDTVGVSS